MTNNFWIGFEKKAGIPGAIGTALGKMQKAPAAAAKIVKDIPGAAKRGVEAVKTQVARNAQELSASKARELGPKLRGARPALDLSAKAAKGKISTGVTSPQSLKNAKGSFLDRTRNVGTALAVGGAAGAYYGMKDPDEQQRR